MIPRQAVVLGVGVHQAAETARLLERLSGRAGALVVRSPVPTDARVRAAAQEAGVVVLGFAAGASWVQLAALLRSMLMEDGVPAGDAETLGGFLSGDLFALANAIAAQLDAPVTIEDRGSRVLAFSGRQDEADPSRVQTVLGRQVPDQYARVLAESGVFDELYASQRPIYVDKTRLGVAAIALPRAAVAVRAGNELLGSIWAAVPAPLSPERSAALADAAKLVALHLLRIRAGADAGRRVRADLLSTALEGGPGAHAALDRLGLAGTPVVPLVLAVLEPGDDDLGAQTAQTDQETARQRIGDGFALHLAAMHPRCAVATIAETIYGLLPVAAGTVEPEEHARRIGADFLDRLGDRVRAVIGIGPCARTAGELTHAGESATRALRVLRARPSGPRVARLDDVHTQTLLLELRDIAAAKGDRLSGPLARLRAYDDRHHTSLVATLAAWLEAFGDIPAAASAQHVHPNTFRYRLRRVTEVGPLDLTDPDARFAAMLQLRVFGEPL